MNIQDRLNAGMKNLKKRIEKSMIKTVPFGEYKWLVVLGGPYIVKGLYMGLGESQEWLMEAFEDGLVTVIDNVKENVYDSITDDAT